MQVLLPCDRHYILAWFGNLTNNHKDQSAASVIILEKSFRLNWGVIITESMSAVRSEVFCAWILITTN
jgi:hypothetical protein